MMKVVTAVDQFSWMSFSCNSLNRRIPAPGSAVWCRHWEIAGGNNQRL